MAELETIKPVAPSPDKPAVSVSVPAGSLPDKPVLAVVSPQAPLVTALSKMTPASVTKFFDLYATPEWRIAHRLWSVRINIFWAIFGGLWVAVPAFQIFLPPLWFAMVCVGMSLAILFARLTNQPGLPG